MRRPPTGRRAQQASHVTSSGDEPGLAVPTPAILRRGEALLVGVRVIPSAARTEVRGVYGDRLKVAVSAPPERGKANIRLVEALAGWLETGADGVRVVSGHASRDKVVAFSGIMEDELRDRLSILLGAPSSKRRPAYGS
jgi:uncharacterized protein (TIGR00251 family)